MEKHKMLALLLSLLLLLGLAACTPAQEDNTDPVQNGANVEPAPDELRLTTYAADWTFQATESFELMASNMGKAVSTGVKNDVGVYSLENIVYVSNPTISGGEPVQVMNIYVPEAYMTQNGDGTYGIDPDGSMTVDYYEQDGVTKTATYTWTAETAPVVFVNTVDGYAGSENFTIESSKANLFYFNYVSKGFIVVSAASRGLAGMGAPGAEAPTTTTDDDGLIVGKAPSGLIDLKAAVAFLKYNDDVLAGSSEKIFTQGASAGGAMSALLGATGDAAEYDPYLKELGAADASTSTYAAQVYCPITDLDHADAAYEWLHQYQTSARGWDGTVSEFDDYQLALHDALIEYYVDYIQGLGLDLGDDGESGSFYDGLAEKVVDALNHAVTTGQHAGGETVAPEAVIAAIVTENSLIKAYLEENGLSLEDVISWNEEEQTFELDSFKIFDMGGTFGRSKSVPAFDSGMESGLFGPNDVAEDISSHFSASYLTALEKLMESDDAEIAARARADYEECAEEAQAVIDSGVTHLMNPMYYMTGESASTMAKYWRFDTGTMDSDLGTVAAWAMYNQLRSLDGYVTEYDLIYGAPHTSAEYLTQDGSIYIANDLMTWIAQAAVGDAVSD